MASTFSILEFSIFSKRSKDALHIFHFWQELSTEEVVCFTISAIFRFSEQRHSQKQQKHNNFFYRLQVSYCEKLNLARKQFKTE